VSRKVGRVSEEEVEEWEREEREEENDLYITGKIPVKFWIREWRGAGERTMGNAMMIALSRDVQDSSVKAASTVRLSRIFRGSVPPLRERSGLEAIPHQCNTPSTFFVTN